jgi:predicted nucleic acid-binding protein
VITHVLDTSAILAHYLNEPGADDLNAILAQGPDAAGISLIALVELRGRLAEVAANPQEAKRALELYTETLTTVLPFSRETADVAMDLRAATRPRLLLVDALIAASAKQHGAILVHRDPHMATISTSLVSQLMLPPKR